MGPVIDLDGNRVILCLVSFEMLLAAPTFDKFTMTSDIGSMLGWVNPTSTESFTNLDIELTGVVAIPLEQVSVFFSGAILRDVPSGGSSNTGSYKRS